MPKSTNPLLAGLRGKFNDQVVVRQTKWGTIVQSAPGRSGKERSPAQKAQEERFRVAAAYAKEGQKKPEYVAAAAGGKKSAYNLATADHMHPPVVEQINLARYGGKAGDVIEVVATDDFMVTGVMVKVTDAGGTLVEMGQAVQLSIQKSLWTYTTTQAAGAGHVKVTAHASDLAGHVTHGEAERDVG